MTNLPSVLTNSVLDNALHKYLDGIPDAKQKKDREFFRSCYNPNQPVSAEDVENILRRLERQNKERGSSKVSKAFKRVFEVFKDYDDVLKTLASADPMPSALIWGGLSLIMNAANRYHELVSNVRSHLQQMGDIIGRLIRYEPLYENSKFRDLLCESYICVFQLLSRIYKEISKTGLQATVSSASSKCIRKLDEIIQKLREKEESVRHNVQLLEAERQRDRQHEQIEKEITTWLLAQDVTTACHLRLDKLQRGQDLDTFLWTKEHPQISSWLDRSSNPELRVMPLCAPPGCGKSTLCAHAIKSVLKVERCSPVLYHFFHFYKPFTAADIIRHFASQLFHALVSSRPCSYAMLQKFKKIIDDANTPARFRAEIIVKDLIELFSSESPVWIFLDGLDEEKESQRWKEAKPVIDFLLTLSRTTSQVRLWSSSLDIGRIQEVFEGYARINVESEMKQDIATFLSRKATELKLSEKGQDLLRIRLKKDRLGGFLWANMLIERLEQADSPADKDDIIIRGPSLDGYYRQFFERIPQSDRKNARHVFALVAYARRPLKVSELQEAVAILDSMTLRGAQNCDQNIQHDRLPYISIIKRVCAPFIVFTSEDDQTDESMEVCHLYHSAILRFLLRNPGILCVEDDGTRYRPNHHCITPRVIAGACIGYLLQPRYSCDLKKCFVDEKEEWTDSNGKPIADHRFLSYAAKYWDKHWDLDDLMEYAPRGIRYIPNHKREAILSKFASETQEDLEIMTNFLESANFRTCLQIQSLLIVNQFFLPTFQKPDIHYLCLKRVLPNWLDIHQSRYWNGVNGTSAHMFLNSWSLHLGKFELDPSEEHSIDTRHLNLVQYTLCEKCLPPRNDRASLAQFDSSGNCFRLGTQIYLRHAPNTFHPVNIPGLIYIEEIATRGSIIAIARRRKPLKGCDLQSSRREVEHSCGRTVDDEDDEDTVLRYWNLFGFEERSQLKDDSTQNPSIQSSDVGSTSSNSSIDSSSDDESSGDAYESWSECSSDYAQDGFEQDGIDYRRPLHQYSNGIEGLDSEDDGSAMHASLDSEDSDESESNGSDGESDSDDSEVSRRKLGGQQIRRPYGEEVLSSDEEDAYYESYQARMQRRKSNRKGSPFLARLCIYNVESPNMPKEIFSFSMELQLPLNDSPPTIHPTHSLVVWPLSGGKLVFGDFETDSYFIRKLKTSTSISEFSPDQVSNSYESELARHIFMKCQFSPCGKFLHVAALEAIADMLDPTSQDQSLAIVAYTFSLCSSQPTRTPPALVHQARIDLGQYPGSSVNNLPFTLTWSERMLYVTERSLTLKIYRISLFAEKSADESVYPIFRPEKTIAMPGTSLRRNVHFFPSSQEGNDCARLILGPHSVYPRHLPPIGCFLNEEIDLGGWVRSAGTQHVPDAQGDGQLIRPMERFNPEEDCDLRPFLFLE
ncbi:hypothetical protein DXG01_011142 [Tephrocybe rancida]|nr:hypothetical protein DXG01_011142 [Tephrocybe rancida]